MEFSIVTVPVTPIVSMSLGAVDVALVSGRAKVHPSMATPATVMLASPRITVSAMRVPGADPALIPELTNRIATCLPIVRFSA
jgi:hypothetical protein